MKVFLPKSPSNDEIKSVLESKLPKYKYNVRLGRFVDAKQSFLVGASVLPKKDGVVVNGNFPSAGASMFFTLFMLARFVLPATDVREPGLLEQAKSPDEVAGVLKTELGG